MVAKTEANVAAILAKNVWREGIAICQFSPDNQGWATELGLTPMKGLILYAGFVIVGIAAAVLIGMYVERQTSPDVGSIVMLVLFFTSLVVSWIVTVFVMDGSLKNFYAEQEQIEAEKKGREYEKRSGTGFQS